MPSNFAGIEVLVGPTVDSVGQDAVVGERFGPVTQNVDYEFVYS